MRQQCWQYRSAKIAFGTYSLRIRLIGSREDSLLATQACTTVSPDILEHATLYSSAEPCAMCAGAIYWAGIGRLVYGLSEHRLRIVTGDHPENPTLDLPCREVFESGQRVTEVLGPLLEDEAEALHEGVWKR